MTEDAPPPRFSTFQDAWSSFLAGGVLEAVSAHAARFTAGRAQFLSLQVRLPQAAAVARSLEDALADVDALIWTPDDLLHASLIGIGWQMIEARRPDEILRQQVGPLAERAARALSGVPPAELAIGPVNVFPDALVLEVHDGGALASLRTRLAQALGREDALGIADGAYLPHVTVAAFADTAVAGALREALPPLRSRPTEAVAVRRIELARWWFTGAGDDREPPECETVREYVLGG